MVGRLMRHLKTKRHWTSKWTVAGLVVVALGVTIVGWRHSASAQQDNSIVTEESPLLREPTTVGEHFDALQLMMKIGRFDWAKRYLVGLLELNPSDEDLLALRDTHGPAVFLRISGKPELQPAGGQLAQKVEQLFKARGEDPTRINQLINTIVNGSMGQAQVAQLSINGLGARVVPHYLKQMASADSSEVETTLIVSLAKVGNTAIDPLIAALETEDADLRSMALQTLGLIGSRDAVSSLWFHAYAPDQPPGVQSAARGALSQILKTDVGSRIPQGVADELQDQSTRYLRNDMAWNKADEDGNVELWTWKPELKTVQPVRVAPKEAALYHSSRFAKQAFEFAPENPKYQAHYLATALAYESRHQTWEDGFATGPGTSFNLALTSGTNVVRDALAVSLSHSQSLSAMGCLKALGQIGTKHDLNGTKSNPSPIIAALNYPDHRVQFVAALTVLELNPSHSFPECGRVVSILTRAMIDDMKKRVLVVDPNTTRGRDVAALFGELGYSPIYAATGRSGFKKVVERSDISLIALNVNTVRWDLSETIENLRADARTAQVPITIYGSEQMEPQVAGLLQRSAPLNYVVDPVSSRGLQVQLNSFLKKLNMQELTTEQREARAVAASHSLAHIAVARQDRIFNLQQEEKALLVAISDPLVSEDVIVALRAVPTANAQQGLTDLVLQESAPVELRVNAAHQLAFHIHQYGLLLPLKSVSQLEVMWRDTQDSQLSTALASVVGSLKPNQKRVGGRLKRYRRPPVAPANNSENP